LRERFSLFFAHVFPSLCLLIIFELHMCSHCILITLAQQVGIYAPRGIVDSLSGSNKKVLTKCISWCIVHS
jgi:hypothetical protein